MASVATIIGYAASALSADHQDGPATTSAPPADINDVYSWVDGSNVVLAMTVYPAAPTGAQFSNNVQYVFHTASAAALGATTNPVDVIATFDATQKIKLWVGASEYVTGDASSPSGLSTADGKVKVFAGLRADPFFFNLDGFKATAADVKAAAASLTFNEAGCPALDNATSGALVNQLKSSADGGAAVNHFAAFNGLAIVVSIDKTLLNKGGADMSVWAGTYATGPIGDAGGQ